MYVYLSGPITGEEAPQALFEQAEEEVMVWAEGVGNPMQYGVDPTGDTWPELMRKSITLMMECDAIYMLEGWDQSKGAIMEHFLAEELEMPIFFQGNRGI